MSGDSPPLVIATARDSGKGWVVRFDGIDNRAAAAARTHHLLTASIDDLAPLEEGEYFHHQIVGLSAVDLEGDELGHVSDLIEVGKSKLLEIEWGHRRILVPMQPEIVLEIDLERRRVVLDPPDGLMEL